MDASKRSKCIRSLTKLVYDCHEATNRHRERVLSLSQADQIQSTQNLQKLLIAVQLNKHSKCRHHSASRNLNHTVKHASDI